MFKGNAEKVTKLPAPRHDQINGLLDKGCTFEGKLTFDGTVQINGDFRGEIFSDGTLVVGTEGRVNAKIAVDTLVVYGRVDGQIEAKSKIEMHVPALVSADIKTRNLSVEDGVVFQGNCQMERASDVNQVQSRQHNDVEATEEESENVFVV